MAILRQSVAHCGYNDVRLLRAARLWHSKLLWYAEGDAAYFPVGMSRLSVATDHWCRALSAGKVALCVCACRDRALGNRCPNEQKTDATGDG